MMTMNGVPVPPEGLDYIKGLEQWLEQYPNDALVRSKLAELQRDPRFAEPDEPDDIMPQVPELSEFPVPPGLKEYIDATRIIAGASVATTAACVAATFNLLAAEDIDVQSRANAPHPSGLYFVVGSESGWRKSSAYRETMQGHVEADDRVHALYSDDDGTSEDGVESKAKGFSPRALRQDFTVEALLSRLWKARRTMAVANSDASSLLGGWSFRRDNLSRTLSHFVNLWDGDPTSIDRRNPEAPEIFFYQRRLTGLIMGQVNVAEGLLFSQAAGNGFTARCLPNIDRERPRPPEDTSTSYQAATDTIARMREIVIRRREDQDAHVELLRGVQRRPVIHPDKDARDLLAAASAKFDAPGRRGRQPPRAGLLGPGPRTDRPLRRHTGLCPNPRGRHTRVLGPRPLQPPRSRTGRGSHQLARNADQVLRNPSSLGENHPAGQRHHHHAPRKAGQGAEGRRNNTSPRRNRPNGQGRAQNRRHQTRTGPGPAGLPPPFDTGSPEGPLHDDGAPILMVGAKFANSANFCRLYPRKFAKFAELAPMVNCD